MLTNTFLSLLAALTLGQQRTRPITANEIMERTEQAFAGVNDFTVTLEAEINMERLKIPKSMATMYFKKPNKVHFSSTGFALVPREGVLLNPSVLRQQYDAALIGETDSLHAYKLQLAAKDVKTRLRQLFVWVDSSSWTIIKAETIPYEGRTLTFEVGYAPQEGRYWLPSTLRATFGVTGPRERLQSDTTISPAPQFEEMQRAPRSGTIIIRYSDWKVNTDLSDEVFESKEVK